MRYKLWIVVLPLLGPSTGGQWPLTIRHDLWQLTYHSWAPRLVLLRQRSVKFISDVSVGRGHDPALRSFHKIIFCAVLVEGPNSCSSITRVRNELSAATGRPVEGPRSGATTARVRNV